MSDNLLSQLWARRSLVILLAFNDVKLRYRNSVLGFLWSFLEPLLMLGVLYFVFTNVFKNAIPNYPLYLLLGLIFWYMFQRGTQIAQTSLIDRAGIIQKIYFRREIIVISACFTAFIMMMFEFIAFAVFVVIFKFMPPLSILLLPLLLVDLLILSVGISLFLSVLTVYFRDLKFIWQVMLQAGFFATPIIYRLDVFPDQIKNILQFNPLVTIIDTAHNMVLYGILPTLNATLYLIISPVIIFIIGYLVFRIKNTRLIEEL